MKPLSELEKILIAQLQKGASLMNNNISLAYYNEIMGDASFMLMAVLESKLTNGRLTWEADKWIDDSLLTKVVIQNDEYKIWGVAIWGREDTTVQWTDPFYFQGTINQAKGEFSKYTFLFAEEGEDVTYEDFNADRGMWDKDFYEDESWNPTDRDWLYIINNSPKVEVTTSTREFVDNTKLGEAGTIDTVTINGIEHQRVVISNNNGESHVVYRPINKNE